MVNSMIPRIQKKTKNLSNLNSNIFICATLDKLFTPLNFNLLIPKMGRIITSTVVKIKWHMKYWVQYQYMENAQ